MSGFAVTISSGMCSSSQGETLPSSSRRLTFFTTFFRSSATANAWGSMVFMTQLHDVLNFSEYLETSNADISNITENLYQLNYKDCLNIYL